MGRIKFIELYKVLKDLKVNGLKANDRMTVVLDTRALRPLAESYEAESELARKQLEPEGYSELVRKTYAHNEAIAKGEKAVMSDAEIAELRRKDAEFNEALKDYFDNVNNEDSVIALGQISEKSFLQLIDINNSLTAGQMELLYDLIVKKE